VTATACRKAAGGCVSTLQPEDFECTQYATSEGDRESCEFLVEAEGAELED
jgi:hypothetical protein